MASPQARQAFQKAFQQIRDQARRSGMPGGNGGPGGSGGGGGPNFGRIFGGGAGIFLLVGGGLALNSSLFNGACDGSQAQAYPGGGKKKRKG